jgi:hypothetical protein
MVHGVAQGATAWRRRNNRTKKQQNLSRFAAKNQHAFYLSLTACAKNSHPNKLNLDTKNYELVDSFAPYI